jgi:two-component system OmpR family sensor kinase
MLNVPQTMIPKSIKWRLQIWYGLILVVVLAGFGLTAYQLERGRLLNEIDSELHRRIGILANALHRPPPRGPNAGRPFLGQPPPGQDFGEPPLNRPPDDDFPSEEAPALQRNRPLPEFHLPAEDARFFDASDPHNFYFTIVSRNGTEIARSTNQPAEAIAEVISNPGHHVNTIGQMFPAPEALTNAPRADKTGSFENHRTTGNVLPSGEMIWVGCSIAPELKELHRTALRLAGVGGIILFFGLAGGGWLVSRAIKPIEEISTTAAKISAGDLSQRINIAETESELGQLAAVLNSTFARLESAFAQQKQFASDAAHELRTPVAVMLTQTQTALNRERDAESYKQTVEACQRAAQRMRKLIESLLELARFDAGQEVLKRLHFDLSRTISDCAELVQPLAEERGIKIISELSPLEITGDSQRLSQVIMNLLTNAIQYNRRGGEVRVSLESQNGLAVLAVADTGPGIAPEDLPRVFERFYRGDKSRTGAGAGLGLSICKAIVEAHGGTIGATSGENAGTIFTVRLPGVAL